MRTPSLPRSVSFRPIALAIVLLIQSFGECPAGESATELFRAIDARLELMEEVARYKAARGIPIEDLDRERVVLERAKADATGLGLDPESVVEFYRAQIEAAKTIQYRSIEKWAAEERRLSDGARDLATEIRPRLLELGEKILQLLASYLEGGGSFGNNERREFTQVVEVENLDPRHERAIYEAMLSVRLKID